ncbi:MAG: Glutamate-1-semialdehyde 2,1-aminomutase [Verrucomicrobia subdivision 3 bacterium]|nr:Glutamate-1-semialdehyde 2,1-aminomutase [Limisphaerales bacterium]MCS1412791.1 Glutamate-1-semialdehyde 2,1-aminomutase [Limisphaerales bacterium]
MANQSQQLMETALRYIPGGVNSPVRAFRAVGGAPFYVDRAKGCRIWDVNGNERIDYVGTWGPAILGHAPDAIISAVRQTAANGTSFGIPNPLEVDMATLICQNVASVDKVRMCNSGTEATMSALRLARGFTQRDKIIKFEGCYHGHVDSLLVKAGSGALTFGNPDSAGVPQSFTDHTIVIPFNRPKAVDAAFAANPDKIAGIILEPVPANAGLYLPQPGFLEHLREVTSKHQSLLIFDEVMTGFRLGFGGAQQRFQIQPDLSCFGKIIGGGLPVGAFGGRAEIMDYLAPIGSVYQAGTLSGNPIAMAAGIAALQELRNNSLYNLLESRGQLLEDGLKLAAKNANQDVRFHRIGSMFCAYFTAQSVANLDDAMTSDRDKFAKFFHGMLEQGIYLAPSQFEAGFLSTAHSEQDIQQTIDAAATVLKQL